MPRHRAASGHEPGGRLVRAGGVVFLLGFVACCLDVLPHPFSTEDRPLPLNLLAYATSAGMALAIWGLWRGIRASMRASAELTGLTELTELTDLTADRSRHSS